MSAATATMQLTTYTSMKAEIRLPLKAPNSWMLSMNVLMMPTRMISRKMPTPTISAVSPFQWKPNCVTRT